MNSKIFTEERLTELEIMQESFLDINSYVIHKEMNNFIIELFRKCKKLEDKIDSLNQEKNNKEIGI